MKSLLLPVLLFFGLAAVAGEPTDSAQNSELAKELVKIQKIEQSLHYQTGRVNLANGVATVNVPKGFRYLGPEDSKKVLEEAWGNLPDQAPLGMIVPGEEGSAIIADYAFIIQFEQLGYVKDEDADKINYDDLLKQMREEGSKENEERRKQGLQTLDLLGWASKPRYDKNSRILYWAKEFRVEGADVNTLNYDVRVLGRRGVLILKAVSDMTQLDSVNQHIGDILGMVTFNEGHRYADFDSKSDEIAAWTIGGLVAGKVLAKVGFFAILLKYIKLIVLGLFAFVGGIWRRITGRRKQEDAPVAYDPAPAPEPQPEPAAAADETTNA